MSGVVVVVNFDGSPVDRRLLTSMVQYMAPRGPDAQEVWIDGNVGFGHAMLRATEESATERQPWTHNGTTWIVADCRIDARADLLRELAASGRVVPRNAPDVHLILHAYDVWGERCVEHFLGDFAFAVWDTRKKSLFCARDHFGVKPFYYARAGQSLILSNTFNCLRFHPALSTELDELAVADFLVYSYPLDTESSVFKAIRRLKPAHTLTVSGESISIRRYWEMPIEEEISYRRRSDVVDQFRELFDLAVGDRLRTSRVSVMMSGGLDSTSIAATATRLLSASGAPFDISAHTIVFDNIVPDEERKYSQLAADRIGIPIHHLATDHIRFPSDEPERDWYPMQPSSMMDRGRSLIVNQGAAESARVVLRGDGADPFLDIPPGTLNTISWRHSGRFAADLLWLTLARRRLPRAGLRNFVRTLGRAPGPAPMQPFPSWFDRSLADKHQLRERWETEQRTSDPRPGFELLHGYWAYLFERYDLGMMQFASEVRYPFLDLRLARFLLRLPPIPWSVEKALLRLAMKNELPREVLARSKAPVAGNPWALLIPPAESKWWREYLTAAYGLDTFVDIQAVESILSRVMPGIQSTNRHDDIDLFRTSMRPIGLNLWLKHNFSANFAANTNLGLEEHD